jgi:carbon-monoxide dehydrogenase small subunit
MTYELQMVVNGREVELEVEASAILLDVLRDKLGLTGTKAGCREGECGACTVLLDGQPVNSCMVPALKAHGCTVLTIEGLSEGDVPHPLQEAFAEQGAVQCGYCTPGMIMAAKAVLDKNPHPSREEIKQGLSGNLCRCTGYTKIIRAVEQAAARGEVK